MIGCDLPLDRYIEYINIIESDCDNDMVRRCQSYYFRNAMEYCGDIDRSYLLSRIWKYMTILGCSYGSIIDEECWNSCPPILRDDHRGVFILPTNI